MQAQDILTWNDVKEKYLEFHKLDNFTENMAIDVDFGYWLVNNSTIPNVCNWHQFSVREPDKNQEIIVKSQDNPLYKPRVLKWDYNIYRNDVKNRKLVWKSWADACQ